MAPQGFTDISQHTPSVESMSIATTSIIDNSSSFDAMSDDVCPDYDAAMSSSSLASTQNRWLPRVPPPNNPVRRLPRPLQKNERYVYTYDLIASGTPLQFLISVEPSSGRPSSGKYEFKLFLRIAGVQRSLCEPVNLNLSIDPRQLTFVVFIFAGKSSVLAGGLWSLRVWLRANAVDHRLFGEDELWIGKDLDFASIPCASIARHRLTNAKEQVYTAPLGDAQIKFIVRWQRTSQGMYKYTLDYDAGGVSSTLFDDLELRLDHDPRHISFLIYTTPRSSLPAGASHTLRVWLRSSLSASQDSLISPTSYFYQRVWKTDSLIVGSKLDFNSLGNKVIMGSARSGPETIVSTESPIVTPSLHARTPMSSISSIDGKDLPGFYQQVYR